MSTDHFRLRMDDASSSKPLSRPTSSLSKPLSSSSSLTGSSLNGSSLNGSIPLSAFQSFSPELPPIRPLANSDSQSSFTIEFREDSQSRSVIVNVIVFIVVIVVVIDIRLSGDECQSNSSILLSSIRRASLSSSDFNKTKDTIDTSSNDDGGFSEDESMHRNRSNTTDISIGNTYMYVYMYSTMNIQCAFIPLFAFFRVKNVHVKLQSPLSETTTLITLCKLVHVIIFVFRI